MLKMSHFFHVALSTWTWLLAVQFTVRPVTALCNLSATLECCELVMPANDPVADLILSLADITALPFTSIGIACTPMTRTSPSW